MKKTSLNIVIILIILNLTVSCAPAGAVATSSTPCPTPPTPAASPDPSPAPVKTAPPTPRPTHSPDYSRRFLDSLPTNPESCLPDQTSEDLGVYIYDLKEARELVSINADVPFQFASAFKGPVLVYFLSSCRKYWDPSDAGWKEYFQNLEAARNIDYYISPEYEKAISEFLPRPENWKDIGNFFAEHRYTRNGAGGPIDTRYFVLEKVYGMIAQSSNAATADVLLFVLENCLDREQIKVEARCGELNAVTAFNAWLNNFAQIAYDPNSPHRGLYSWDTVLENGTNGSQEITLSTFGQKDLCANQTAILKCDPIYTAFNTLTARDFFKFYSALYKFEDEGVRETALALLKVDESGPARGYLKNMARNMHAVSLSKNGHAFFTNGSINTDTGILLYKGKAFIIVTLSFNALTHMEMLYGSYDSTGNLISNPGLIQNLLEQATESR